MIGKLIMYKLDGKEVKGRVMDKFQGHYKDTRIHMDKYIVKRLEGVSGEETKPCPANIISPEDITEFLT